MGYKKKNYADLLEYYDSERSEIKEILNFCDFKGKIILDLGCGEGRNSFGIATKAKYVYCLEPSHEMIEIANKNKKIKSLVNIEFKQGRAEEIPFPDNFFDIVITTWALHEFADLKKSLEEIKRVLKKDGEIFFLEPTDNSEFNKIELEACFKLNKSVNLDLLEFWIQMLTFLNENGFKWKMKTFEPKYVFPNLDTASKMFPIIAETGIEKEPNHNAILKSVLKKYEKKNETVEFHDQAIMVLAKK